MLEPEEIAAAYQVDVADIVGPAEGQHLAGVGEMSIAGEDAEQFVGEAPTLALKEFKSTILPKECGTRKVPTWHTADEARDYWVQRCSEYSPVMTQVTPRHKLRLTYVFGGRMTVAGEVVIDLAAAAKIKIEGLTNDDD